MRKSTLNRMLELSNIKTLNEDKRINLSNFDLVKESVNGKTYAIVRENKTYHIKEAETKENLSESDFDYIGGIANKTKKSFTSFSEATRKLNFMFGELVYDLKYKKFRFIKIIRKIIQNFVLFFFNLIRFRLQDSLNNFSMLCGLTKFILYYCKKKDRL